MSAAFQRAAMQAVEEAERSGRPFVEVQSGQIRWLGSPAQIRSLTKPPRPRRHGRPRGR